MSRHEFNGLPHDRAYQEMMRLFDELSFRERMRRMMDGLGKPRDTGDYKFARLQLQRLSAPLVAVVAPLVVLAILFALGDVRETAAKPAPVDIARPDALTDLVDPPLVFPDDIEPQPIGIIEDLSRTVSAAPVEDRPMSPQNSSVESMPVVHRPIPLRDGHGFPALGARGVEIGARVNTPGETAVMRALRWLAIHQESDGSWGKNKTAMTGLALLSFLAHGETPASEEFGGTVEKAIRFLVESQQSDGLFRNRDGHNYSHPIAAFALAEAYTLTRVPMLKTVVERAMVPIVAGQNAAGGWDYNLRRTTRNDTSYMGWCAQAIKAALDAGDLDIPGLEEAAAMAIRGFKTNAHPEGGFGYTSPGPRERSGLTGVGVLGMQLLGAGNDPDVQRGLALIDRWVVGFPEGRNVPGGSHQYYFYYATQAVFHAGGERWQRWNRVMLPAYVSAQTIIPEEQSGYVDHLGTPHAIGFWENSDRHGDRPVMDTTLTALQLMIYYRYLPNFQTHEFANANSVQRQTSDVPVEIRF